MAADAPLHLQRSIIKHQWHAVHRAVAGVAAYALVDVNAVIEINEVWEVVDPVPYQRFAAAKTLADWFQKRRGRPNLRMTVHASLCRRNSGEARSFYRGVAVPAINPQRSHVMLMAEGRGLRPHYTGISHIGRALQLDTAPQHCCHREYTRVNRGPRNYVRAAMKNLHLSDF